MDASANSMIAGIDSADIVWIVVALAVLMFLTLASWIIIKKKFGSPQRPYQQSQTPFTLKQLDKMLSGGEISQEEYQVLRDKIVRLSREENLHDSG